MTDAEINEAIAVKLGWEDIHKVQTGQTVGNPPNQLVAFADEIPDYCHSISAAWEIVEHIKQDRDITIFLIVHGNYACCRISPESISLDVEEDLASERAGELPMAICLAFLKLDKRPNIS